MEVLRNPILDLAQDAVCKFVEGIIDCVWSMQRGDTLIEVLRLSQLEGFLVRKSPEERREDASPSYSLHSRDSRMAVVQAIGIA